MSQQRRSDYLEYDDDPAWNVVYGSTKKKRGSVKDASEKDYGYSSKLKPKHFRKPLTCYYWAKDGCLKSASECAYAHYDTGYFADAPVKLGSGATVAGRSATYASPYYGNRTSPSYEENKYRSPDGPRSSDPLSSSPTRAGYQLQLTESHSSQETTIAQREKTVQIYEANLKTWEADCKAKDAEIEAKQAALLAREDAVKKAEDSLGDATIHFVKATHVMKKAVRDYKAVLDRTPAVLDARVMSHNSKGFLGTMEEIEHYVHQHVGSVEPLED